MLGLKDPETDQQIMHSMGLIAFNRDYIYEQQTSPHPSGPASRETRRKSDSQSVGEKNNGSQLATSNIV